MAAPREIPAEVKADAEVVPEVSIPDIPAVIQNAPIGSERLAFEPWRPVALGDASNLENLRRNAARERVQGALKITVETEGPVSQDRLSKLDAAAFGRRMTDRLRARLSHQIKQFPGTIDSDGFVWPPDIDPSEWRKFRPGARAQAEDLSPREVANAMRYWADRLGASVAGPEVQAATLATFGRRRRTTGILSVIDRALPLVE